MKTARQILDESLSEADWQAQIIRYAEAHNWHWRHVPDSRRVNADWPDLELVRVITVAGPLPWHIVTGILDAPDTHALERIRIQLGFIECKRQGAKPTDGQRRMIALLSMLPGCWAMVAQPSDWPELE